MASRTPHARDGDARPLLGASLMVLAMAVIPLMDGIAKHLSATLPVLEIVWARYFFHLLLLLPIVALRHGLGAMVLHRSRAQVLRGGLLLGSTALFFAAIARMPLADAIVLVFVAPLVVTALSPVVLGEHVGPRRWSAVLVGLVGVVVIVRPGAVAFGAGTLLALGAGVTYAGYSLATRRLRGAAPPLVTLAYTAALGAVLTSALVPLEWVTPCAAELALMAAMGGIAAVGHYLVIRAFECAEASLLAPIGYSELVMSTVVGYVAFGDLPDGWTWVGAAIVIASGVYISVRESRQARR